MTSTDRADFLAERSQGVGGSDVASVFSLGYGCRLRLWFDKTNTPADYPDEDSGPMKLGRWLEPHIADEYAAVTGRQVTVESQRQHPDHPEMLVHIDRRIKDVVRPGIGVLEIKAFGRGMFAKMKREGLPIDYILQVQHAIAITGYNYGAYAAMNRDTGALEYWDVEPDGQVVAAIEEEVPIFWRSVLDREPPDRLDPDDARCQSCRWRRTCQGNALMESRTSEIEQADELVPLLAEHDERKAMADEAAALLDETREVLRTALGERQAVDVRGRKVYNRPQQRKSWESERMAGDLARALGTVDYDGTFVPRAPALIEGRYKLAGKAFKVLRIF